MEINKQLKIAPILKFCNTGNPCVPSDGVPDAQDNINMINTFWRNLELALDIQPMILKCIQLKNTLSKLNQEKMNLLSK